MRQYVQPSPLMIHFLISIESAVSVVLAQNNFLKKRNAYWLKAITTKSTKVEDCNFSMTNRPQVQNPNSRSPGDPTLEDKRSMEDLQ